MAMRIKVLQGKGGWRWGFVSGGRLTANNETHASPSKAKRAAKAVVMSVLRKWQYKPRVVWTEKVGRDGAITLDFTPDIVQEA